MDAIVIYEYQLLDASDNPVGESDIASAEKLAITLTSEYAAGSIDQRERLIPWLPGDTVARVDLDEGLIEVDWFVDED